MDTLIKLLNEYEEELSEKKMVDIVDMAEIFPCYWNDKTIKYKLNKVRIISKDYGFINWLVDNDKITTPSLIGRFDEYETVLCNLAISDTPIEDLISYLNL